MTYTKQRFGKALLEQLAQGYDPRRLAHWAYTEHLDHSTELEEGLRDDMMAVIFMGEGAQFHLSETELRSLADRLLKAD